MKKIINLIALTAIVTGLAASMVNATSSIDPAGFMRAEGQPFFMVGFYFEHGGSVQNHVTVIKRLSGAGFNTIFITGDEGTTADLQRIFDTAQVCRIKVIVENLQPAGYSAVVNKPALLAWSIATDVNNLTVDELKARYDAARAADTTHFTYTSAWNDQNLDGYIKYAGAIGAQTYPIPTLRTWMTTYSGSPDITFASYLVSKLMTAKTTAGAATVITQETQAFNWNRQAGDRAPTGTEVDNMNYQAIIAGAKGLLPYTYSGCCAANSDIWNMLVKHRGEMLDTLAPVLLLGKRTALTVGGYANKVFAACWEYHDSVYVIAVNSLDQNVTVTLNLPATVKSPVTKIFASRSGGMTLSGSALSGSIGALGVQMYKTATNSSTALTKDPAWRRAVRNNAPQVSVGLPGLRMNDATVYSIQGRRIGSGGLIRRDRAAAKIFVVVPKRR